MISCTMQVFSTELTGIQVYNICLTIQYSLQYIINFTVQVYSTRLAVHDKLHNAGIQNMISCTIQVYSTQLAVQCRYMVHD